VVAVLCVLVAAGCGFDDPDPRPAPVQQQSEPDVRVDEVQPVEAVPPSRAVPGVASVPVAGGEVEATPSPGSRFPRPDSVRGLYVNAWSAGSRRRLAQLLELADSTEINTFVIDIKDATGYVSHASAVPALREVGATGERRIADLPALLDTLEARGIYPIARIVVVKDPLLAAARPELAVQDTAGGPWIDSKGIVWLDLWNPQVLDYHLSLAKEVAALGFPEVQWDYIRFPDAPAADMARAVFARGDGERPEAVRSFLETVRDTLAQAGMRSTADVFGVTTSYRIDVGIGQVWESFIDVVDAALPMVYPSHYYTGSFDYDVPNAHPYEVVYEALDDAVRRSAAVDGAGEVVPWLQDFSLGPPVYDAPEVRAQIQAAYDAGLKGWILWNPASRYTESALMPAAGWATEPEIRVASQLVPVSRRREVLVQTPVEALRPDSLVADSVGPVSTEAADSAGGAG
jgi:hypothetical protein